MSLDVTSLDVTSLADDRMPGLRRARRAKDARDYALAFWVALPFFLAAAAWSRLTARHGDETAPEEAARAGRQQSIFRQAWVAANSSIPFAFMD
jgi:hypothetical protein